ncbi:alkaline ceramidase ydc1 [Coemansia javaensis]|uniref:Alkaline ceramidase ydc1 n=1 Tax=Coemansia javaensis TaxID=2761396 RepID=A0A9W8H6J8_9FUNG|nr:alkaline ceramidase ydc1 [Coemansia javaensis]
MASAGLPLVGGDHYWGPATATIDWCEENYALCKYVAEFWNTTTNTVFFALAMLGMWRVHSMGHERRFLLCYFSMLVVGLGSWLFHMTLKYQWQLADELPMLYGTCACIYCVLRADAREGAGLRVSAWLFAYATAVTLVYVQIRMPVFHQVAYALEVAVVLVRSAMHQIEIRKTDLRAHSELIRLFWLGTGSFGMAFVLWNVDNIFCNELLALRAALPVAVAPLLQLHAYWHIGTALGCYASIVYQQYLRLVKLGAGDSHCIQWLLYVLPYVERRPKAAAR